MYNIIWVLVIIPYYYFRPFLLIQSFAYNLPVQHVSPLDRNTGNAPIILTSNSFKASKVAYSPKGIVYV